MPRYNVTTTVTYYFEVEADDRAGAEAQGWDYEDWYYTGEVDSIEVRELEDEDENE